MEERKKENIFRERVKEKHEWTKPPLIRLIKNAT